MPVVLKATIYRSSWNCLLSSLLPRFLSFFSFFFWSYVHVRTVVCSPDLLFFFCLRLLFSTPLFPSFFSAISFPFFFLRLLDIHCYLKRRSDLRFLTCTSRSHFSRLCLIRLLYSSRCVFYNFFFA